MGLGGSHFKARPDINSVRAQYLGTGHTFVTPVNRRIMVLASQGKKQDPISKITRAERTGGVAQA
jgi:hypothetical protein